MLHVLGPVCDDRGQNTQVLTSACHPAHIAPESYAHPCRRGVHGVLAHVTGSGCAQLSPMDEYSATRCLPASSPPSSGFNKGPNFHASRWSSHSLWFKRSLQIASLFLSITMFMEICCVTALVIRLQFFLLSSLGTAAWNQACSMYQYVFYWWSCWLNNSCFWPVTATGPWIPSLNVSPQYCKCTYSNTKHVRCSCLLIGLAAPPGLPSPWKSTVPDWWDTQTIHQSLFSNKSRRPYKIWQLKAWGSSLSPCASCLSFVFVG